MQTKEEENYSVGFTGAEPAFGLTKITPHSQLASAVTRKPYLAALHASRPQTD